MIEFLLIVCFALMIGARTPEQWKEYINSVEE